ncbi:hypothetical protein NQ318_006972 [Aromia moschata]|uniref:HTH CENPB-type domain-containing protein n=1 Tax=Aromia moschata TaxID=1265417 RepID=A0AAV8Y5J2_9CUCU|nr:hypothetical protein NQ318_006972 [Aromia moschata]
MHSKRKHITLSIKQKSDILERLNRGECGKVLSKEYGVGTSTISDIKKNKDKIKRFIGQCDSGPGSRKTLRKAEYTEMETRLYACFCTQRSRHVPISYEILSAKAKQFYTETYGNDNFAAIRGWISNFRKRHGLRSLKVHGTVEELTSEDGKFTTIFLPPNCIALLQPMDQNANRLTKLFYRKSLLAHILSNNEKDVVKVLKTLNLKDAVCLLYNARGKISSEVLQKCWHKILPQVTADTEYEAEDLIPLNQLRRNMLSSAEDITDISDMLNILTEQNQNLTNMEIHNWLENDEALLALEDIHRCCK